ncbi:hypothetical protein ACRAWD_21950 [Caulobacter segnis]
MLAVQVEGYAAVGDYGRALYRRVSAQPAHGAAFQSADGAWWELAETDLRPEMLGGGVNALAAVNTTALLALRDYARGLGQHVNYYLPEGDLYFQTSRWLHGIKRFAVYGGGSGTRLWNTRNIASTSERVALFLNQDLFYDNAEDTNTGVGTWNVGDRIPHSPKFSDRVTLMTPSAGSHFVVGGWALVYGWNMCIVGGPPAMRFFEFRRVLAVNADTGVITLDQKLKNAYRSDWVDNVAGSGADGPATGAARILSLSRSGACRLSSMPLLTTSNSCRAMGRRPAS